MSSNRKVVTSDLVYSPAQVTEHHRMELKDQDVSHEAKDRFEELKKKHPKVFSVNNEDIGCTTLLTMDIDTGDSPQCVKNCTPFPSNIMVGLQLRPWSELASSKRTSAPGPV